jgi:DNA-binding CsgD family transcriptional regulator
MARTRPPVDIPPPHGLSACSYDHAGDEYVLFEWARAPAIDCSGLTRAESEVLDLVLGGKSNAEVASSRGRSARTIANQVAALFRKLGVGSRLELYARAAGKRAEPGQSRGTVL